MTFMVACENLLREAVASHPDPYQLMMKLVYLLLYIVAFAHASHQLPPANAHIQASKQAKPIQIQPAPSRAPTCAISTGNPILLLPPVPLGGGRQQRAAAVRISFLGMTFAGIQASCFRLGGLRIAHFLHRRQPQARNVDLGPQAGPSPSRLSPTFARKLARCATWDGRALPPALASLLSLSLDSMLLVLVQLNPAGWMSDRPNRDQLKNRNFGKPPIFFVTHVLLCVTRGVQELTVIHESR